MTCSVEEDHRRKLAEEERALAKDAWVTATMRRFDKTVKGTEKSVATGKKNIEELQRKLTEEVRRLHGKEQKLCQLEQSRSSVRERYEKQFESAMKAPQIVRVATNSSNNQQIDIFTTVLEAHVGDYHKLLGRYNVQIFMDGSNGGVKAFNLDRQVDGYWHGSQHPHINSNGAFCLGTMQEAVPQLIGDDQIAALTLMIINHLQNGINPSDEAGAYIRNWPDIPGYYEKEEVTVEELEKAMGA